MSRNYKAVKDRCKHLNTCEVRGLMGNLLYMLSDVKVPKAPSGANVTEAPIKKCLLMLLIPTQGDPVQPKPKV